jgi:YYY domain-containing protein
VSWIEATARWYGVIAALTWAIAPMVRWLCGALPDRGTSVARPIALLVALYPAWLLASIGAAAYDGRPIVATTVLCGLLGWIGITTKGVAIGRWLRDLAVVEAASLASLALYLWLRGYTPQIVGTEKPMDIAFLASSSRTVTMPPPDPWFAGQPINYYYLGYMIHGTIGRLAGVPPEIGFNLALATIFSMTVVTAFGVVWNVVRPRFGTGVSLAAGLFTAFSLAISGNLYAPVRLLLNPAQTIGAWWWDSAVGIGWRSSRIVCDGPRAGNLCSFPAIETINEFPFFSFLLGDLHPHLMALPYTVMAITLGWNLANSTISANSKRRSCWFVRVAISGALVGSLYALNAWDFPTFLAISAVGIFVGFRESLRQSWQSIALLGLASVLAWWPFFSSYDPPTMPVISGLPSWLSRLPLIPSILSAVALYSGERTSIAEYLTIFGIPYAFGVGLVAIGIVASPAAKNEDILKTLLIAVAATLIPGVLLSAPVIPLCGVPMVFAFSQIKRLDDFSPRSFALGAYCAAWLLSIVVELIFVRDVFNSRMNTLFKFYYQAWTLYALATGVTIAVIWTVAASQPWRRTFVVSATVLAVMLGIAYPVVASYQWTEHFSNWQGLDGLAYGEETDPDDTAAIRWLAANAAPGDSVLEAAGCSYRPFSRLPFNRISAFTGIPTVIGWDNHERQWRAGQPAMLAEIRPREGDVATMYADPQSPLFDQYNVRWMVVGTYELGDWHSDCPTAGPYPHLSAPGYPGAGWEEVFRSQQTRIYRKNSP